MQKNYTTTEATRAVLNGMEVNRKYTGGELHRMIISDLRLHGSDAQPYDSTTLRMVRQYASLYGVHCELAGQRSKYIKEAKSA